MRPILRPFLVAFLTACLAPATIGCDGQALPAESPAAVTPMVYAITVDQTPNGQFSAILPDGTTFTSLADYEQNIPTILQDAIQNGYDVQINYGPGIASVLNQDLGPIDPPSSTNDGVGRQDYPIYIGWGYNLTASAGYTYVSGCVSRNAYRVAIHLNQYSNQIFDLHLATYSLNGYRCFGAYESVHGWINWCTCSPVSYAQVKNMIYAAAIAVGISSSIASIIAATGAPMAIAALAL